MSLEQLFTLLSDEAWHNLIDLAHQLEIRRSTMVELSKRFAAHGIVQYEEESSTVKIKHLWWLLLPVEEELAGTETLTVPPHTKRTVKTTHVENLTDSPVELKLQSHQGIQRLKIRPIETAESYESSEAMSSIAS